MNTNATTNFIRYSEPTVRSSASQAYSQCVPEPNYGYVPEPSYHQYYGEQAPMPQQPMPVQRGIREGTTSEEGSAADRVARTAPRAACAGPADGVVHQ